MLPASPVSFPREKTETGLKRKIFKEDVFLK
jgi:hypothetical protein